MAGGAGDEYGLCRHDVLLSSRSLVIVTVLCSRSLSIVTVLYSRSLSIVTVLCLVASVHRSSTYMSLNLVGFVMPSTSFWRSASWTSSSIVEIINHLPHVDDP